MKVFLSTDIEGITGLASWSQCGRPDSNHFDYRWARERYTADVNAAIDGCFDAGASLVMLKDSHGNSKNLLIDQLRPGVEMVTGYGATADGMMAGIDSSFEAAALIGYHARAGTLRGTMEHTISGRVHRMWINDFEMGEIGLSALTAGHYGVPLVALSSDAAGCAEGADLISGLKTAQVKRGMGRYMTQTLHPDQTASLIRKAVADGVLSRAVVMPFTLGEIFSVKIEFNRTEEADYCERLPGARRVDGYSLEYGPSDWRAVHGAIWTMISLAQAGFEANS